jgi:hypothetical protein
MRKFVKLVAPIVIAVVLGPLIAGLAVCVLAVGVNLYDHTEGLPVTDLFGLFKLYIIFAYLMGGVIALLAGILVSVWMIWRPPSAIVVIAAAVIATCSFLGVGALGFLGPVEFTNARSNFLFILALAVIAAGGCWLLTRRFVRTT